MNLKKKLFSLGVLIGQFWLGFCFCSVKCFQFCSISENVNIIFNLRGVNPSMTFLGIVGGALRSDCSGSAMSVHPPK